MDPASSFSRGWPIQRSIPHLLHWQVSLPWATREAPILIYKEIHCAVYVWVIRRWKGIWDSGNRKSLSLLHNGTCLSPKVESPFSKFHEHHCLCTQNCFFCLDCLLHPYTWPFPTSLHPKSFLMGNHPRSLNKQSQCPTRDLLSLIKIKALIRSEKKALPPGGDEA